METRILMRSNDDEIEDWYLDQGGAETHIIYANHDDHGWSGMQAIRDTISLMAEAAGWEVVIEYPED